MAASTVDTYLSGLSSETRTVTEHVWSRLQRGVPDGEPCIAYGIPTLKVNGRSVVHVGGWTSHVSVYPIPHDDHELRHELSPYIAGRGTLKFSLRAPVPYDLIERVAVALRAEHDAHE